MMRTPTWWAKPGPVASMLLPASWLYGVLSRARYAKITPHTLSVPVICVGNAIAGGAGKTPTALAIAELVKSIFSKPYFLSRGYGGALAGPLQVDINTHTAAQVGDEPLLLAATLPTIVAHDRLQGAHYAVDQGADVIIMDDGFQNPVIHKDLSLLVVDATVGFGNGKLLPAGPLREPVEDAFARSSAMILIGNPANVPASFSAYSKHIINARIVPEPSLSLQNERVIGFCGIAYPAKFKATLKQTGATIVDFHAFGDHHIYSLAECAQLEGQARHAQAKLITTSKDWVRLPSMVKEKVQPLPIQLQFTDASALNSLLRGLKKEQA